jgi:hypothetical protein
MRIRASQGQEEKKGTPLLELCPATGDNIKKVALAVDKLGGLWDEHKG